MRQQRIRSGRGRAVREADRKHPEPEPDVSSQEDALDQIELEDLPPKLRQAVQRVGWKALLPVQAKTIPYIRARRDLMVQSRTGTGKTAAFVLPILERLDPDSHRCQALVLAPTRELARQVSAEAERLASDTRIRTVAVYGGVGYGPQLSALRDGAQLVVGTPGRVLDHIMKGSLNLDDLDILVFDEADRMLSVGFYPDMKRIAAYLPKERDGYMFSATYPPGVRSLAGEFLREPSFLSLSRDGEFVADTDHIVYEVPAMEKDRALVRIIEIENPDSAIIFCNTKAAAHYVSVVLRRFGYDAAELSADLNQSAREKVLERIYHKNLRFLVATDVAARGIDIELLSHVILYDFPDDHEMYIHRTGRTGRAGARGVAISLVDVLERLRLATVVKQYGIDMERRPTPTDADVEAIVTERVTALLEAKLRDLDGLVRERMQRMLPLARNYGESEDELAITAMLLDEFYQSTIHKPAGAPPDANGDGGRQEITAEAALARSGRRGGGRRGRSRRR